MKNKTIINTYDKSTIRSQTDRRSGLDRRNFENYILIKREQRYSGELRSSYERRIGWIRVGTWNSACIGIEI